MKHRLALVFTLILALALPRLSRAQTQAPITGGENLHIYLLTFGPGDQVWERFGHNAIWVQDETFGIGAAYNWGMFSFKQPGFVPRLMKGKMLYWMAGYDSKATMDLYVSENRSIWAQELNLTPQQRVDMAHFLEWNVRDENKFYLYDYFRDNCSTRVRDAIDRFSGGSLSKKLKNIPTKSTYRSHTAALTYTDPLTYTGLMLAMGPRIDQPLNAWQESFIPMELREWVRQGKVRAPDGTEQPLVLAERTIFEANRDPVAAAAPNRIIPFTFVGVVLAVLLLMCALAAKRYRAMNVVLAILIGVWSLAVGFFGTLIELLWAFTNHVVTYRNENVLQANTLSLLLAGFAVAALMGSVRARRWAVWLALFVAGCSALGFMIQALPQFDQVNGDIIGLMMPIHGIIAYILWYRWKVIPSTAPLS